MLAFIVSRLLQSLAVMLAVSFLCFVLFNFVGDPVNNMVGQEASTSDREEMRRDLGLEDSVAVQFIRFLGNAMTGNFGKSYRLARPVSDLIVERMPATLELVAVAALLALCMGIPLGVVTALRRHTVDSGAIMTFSLAGVAMPTFVIGILLIYVFSVECKSWAPAIGLPPDWCFPSFGRGETVKLGWWSTGLLTAAGLKAIVLPAFTLSLFQMTLVLRLVRSQMLEVLRTDYIKFARARGLTDRAVHFRHALKNTLLPVITVIGIQIGGLIAFSIITETVFQWPGMGQLFIQSVQFADIPVMAAYLVMVSFIFVAINFLVDLLYATIDPRLRLDRAQLGTAGG
ncbi:ABC transporter permease [Reyranella sp.]|uniref:ABC transporter permease n=1 Tax=Reyranella sp. TaxID=1929291 RepID=UPI0027306301|nr:ABC transporter permease [Reyranella sp.]MDP2372411.1 ABC transporter permease [Reyranella sp.]